MSRRNSGNTAVFNRGVTVATIDSKSRHRVFVTERDCLLARNARLGYIGRSVKRHEYPKRQSDQEYCPENADLEIALVRRWKI